MSGVMDAAASVARSSSFRAIVTAKRLGMEWVGETTKYYDLRLQSLRVWPSDLPG